MFFKTRLVVGVNFLKTFKEFNEREKMVYADYFKNTSVYIITEILILIANS